MSPCRSYVVNDVVVTARRSNSSKFVHFGPVGWMFCFCGALLYRFIEALLYCFDDTLLCYICDLPHRAQLLFFLHALSITKALSVVWIHITAIAADGLMCGCSFGPDR